MKKGFYYIEINKQGGGGKNSKINKRGCSFKIVGESR